MLRVVRRVGWRKMDLARQQEVSKVARAAKVELKTFNISRRLLSVAAVGRVGREQRPQARADGRPLQLSRHTHAHGLTPRDAVGTRRRRPRPPEDALKMASGAETRSHRRRRRRRRGAARRRQHDDATAHTARRRRRCTSPHAAATPTARRGGHRHCSPLHSSCPQPGTQLHTANGMMP